VPVTMSAPPSGTPSPRLTLLAPRKKTVKAGKRLKIAWKKHVKGEVRFVEVQFSPDHGASWQYVTATSNPKQHTYVWTVPSDAVADAAQIRLVLWAQVQGVPNTDAGVFARTMRENKPFRIVP